MFYYGPLRVFTPACTLSLQTAAVFSGTSTLKMTKGEQSSGLTPTKKLEVIVILREHQLSLLNNKNDITAIPGGVSVVLVVSNLTLTQSCHITATKLQAAFLICQYLNVFYYH